MHCLVTAGPTYEPIDQVRRLTNFSSGRLGVELANFLEARGHDATLMLGEQATYSVTPQARKVIRFSTGEDLSNKIRAVRWAEIGAVFHAAAVGDFAPGKLWWRDAEGRLEEVEGGKVSSRLSGLMMELIPVPKILVNLRGWFPQAVLVGWKYEVDGDRGEVLAKARHQVKECLLTAAVANGPAYGEGYGVVGGDGPAVHAPDLGGLCQALHQLLEKGRV